MTTLFETVPAEEDILRPLADRMRPKHIQDVFGQDHLLGTGKPITQMLETQRVSSFILWGPPGSGKTTLAKIVAGSTDSVFEEISAIFSGVSDLKKIFETAKIRKQNGQSTILFVDEIHRFNKSQQDAFLPVVEDGTIILIGATTENPSFELNNALLSRCQVFILKALEKECLEKLLGRLEELEGPVPLTEEAKDRLIAMVDGDGRYLITMVERIYQRGDQLDLEQLVEFLQKRTPLYDKGDEEHYNLISALHKSVRGSDPQAALYWFSRMMEGGEDPHYIARRLVRMASEDIGLADPQALSFCMHAWQAYERLGDPEGDLCLAQAVLYLACAPKSNAAYVAAKKARQAANQNGSLMPPAHILNAPTTMMKDQGFGKGYVYDPDTEDGFSGQSYFPESMCRQEYYEPYERGFEREITKRIAYWNKLRDKKQCT